MPTPLPTHVNIYHNLGSEDVEIPSNPGDVVAKDDASPYLASNLEAIE
jgi:hypothetical protein